ncbi:hypothetical protein H0E87_021891 [Populus deltoides]|uniref:Bulb-type lectin domain-containing protein n=1 Tax=Populus deltoides TaxID=3696 RepID=A0A8T2XH90_POPDE|nr:hypothetical protein H0E87_021891 [Populus deltoides]
MNVCWPKCCCWVFRFLVLQHLVYLITAQPYVDPVMLVGNSWKTKTVGADTFRDGSLVRAILASATSDPKFACDHPVQSNATLQLTSGEGLVLKDVDGCIAWSTNTTGKSVASMNLTDKANLVLFDDNNATVWQSFDHPTDCLLPGQNLMAGQKLTPTIFFDRASSAQHMRIGSDRHLRVYDWEEFDRCGWNEVADLFTEEIDECSYPTVCGKFGICSNGQKCRCPEPTIQGTTYFKREIEKQPEIGCLEITPLSCNASQSQIFLEVKVTSYFAFHADLGNVTLETCKVMCLRNCSCKAVVFRYHSDPAMGDCYLPPDIFSLKDSDNSGYHSVYLKVQNAPHAVPQGMKRRELAKENRLMDLVNNQSEHMRFNKAEMMTIMRVAAWCLQSDYAKRPSMSMLLNFLEDDLEIEGNLDNSSSNPALKTMSIEQGDCSPSSPYGEKHSKLTRRRYLSYVSTFSLLCKNQ